MANESYQQVIDLIFDGNIDRLLEIKNLREILKDKDSKGCTVLIAVAKVSCPHKRYSRCIEHILKLGADPAAVDCNGDTAAHVAARCGNLRILALLPFEAKFLTNGENCTPLMEAVRNCRFRCAKHLLHLFRQKRYFHRKKELLNIRNKKGKTALALAKDSHHNGNIVQEMVEIISNEAKLSLSVGDPTAADVNGETSLHFAALRSKMHAVKLLVEEGVPVNISDSEGQTPVMWAATSPSQVASTVLTMHGWLICVIMAHGNNGKIVVPDGKELQIKEIVDQFNSYHCSALQHKPKVFIIQACRGERMDVQRPTDSGPSGDSSYSPVESDILIFYSATEGYASYRGNTEEEVSPFIQTLCKVITEYHRTEHLADMLTIVNRRLKETPIESAQGVVACYAVPQIVSQLSKKLYL
uniref:ANK_REP_REGION domain-containing protein n=1 Tax=Macrostomum lignano TaxID=282301 RepID=A0A1I8HKM7_9PLAT